MADARTAFILSLIGFIIGWQLNAYIFDENRAGYCSEDGLCTMIAAETAILEKDTINIGNYGESLDMNLKKNQGELMLETKRHGHGQESFDMPQHINGQEAGAEAPSPFNRVDESDIMVTDEGFSVRLKGAEWAGFADTNSMDPVIDCEAHAIQIVPSEADEIHVGDIVSYVSDYDGSTIIHRVINISTDEKGAYFTLKGDNNPHADPERVRFRQVSRVLVALVY